MSGAGHHGGNRTCKWLGRKRKLIEASVPAGKPSLLGLSSGRIMLNPNLKSKVLSTVPAGSGPKHIPGEGTGEDSQG